MATRTRDIAPLGIKGKRSPNTSKTNTNATNRNNIPSHLKSKVSSGAANTQAKKPAAPPTYPNIHHKQTLDRRTSNDKPPSSLDNNTQGKKLAPSSSSSSCDLPNIRNKQTLNRRTSNDMPPSCLDNTQGKKLAAASPSCVPPQSSSLDKQTLTRRRLSFDHKPPLLKNRTPPIPRERILKPSLLSSSKNSTSQKPLLNKLSKAPHTSSKDIIGKQHGADLYARTVNMNKPASLTAKEFVITSYLTDVVENIDSHEGEELVQEEYQELVIEDHEELSEIIDIDEYLKAAESSSLYVVENQQLIMMEVPEEHQFVEETSIIKNHEEIKNLDLEVIEKQESVMIAEGENQEEKEEDQESEILVKALDDCQQKKEDQESEILVKALDDCQQKKEEGKELDLNIDQEEKEESEEGRNNKGKEENNDKISTTMAFAKAYPHLVQGKNTNTNTNTNNNNKESIVSNNVIEERESKLREQRKNRVKALASAFETVISLQDPK